VCESLVRGENGLLVMPTGAGKSLCYQLPGLALGGPTLVVSPLIALMDDQVQKLGALGLRAAAIHSGRHRFESRQACVDYVAGKLDFLFIAPERLGVTRFAEFLAKHKPKLIAIDEAHCISHWGHDFRPDYRLLQQRLPQLMPCPVVALTATATAKVQDDIITQLGVHPVVRHVFGFRRENLAIEASELTPAQRSQTVERLLADPAHRPAIVYAPTRKEAEKQAESLRSIGARAYHAGMENTERERISSAFLRGETDVIVATVAFGMGIDKPNVRTVVHTALPSSVEGYYQEIGRAGRDGLPSRAVLLHSFADVRTHLWFLDRDYPPVETIQKVFAALGGSPRSREELLDASDLPAEDLDRALEKLLIHGGAELVRLETDCYVRGNPGYSKEYIVQREHKRAQLDAMAGYTEGGRCRMLALVRHFGDQEDSGELCGLCDLCAPARALCTVPVALAKADLQAMQTILSQLRDRDSQAIGKLFRDSFEGVVERKQFQALLSHLERAGWLELSTDEFQKDGQVIRFQRATLTLAGHRATMEDLQGLRVAQSLAPKARKRSRDSGSATSTAGAGTRRPELPPADDKLVRCLKDWRRAIALDKQAPAYTVMTDRALYAIAIERPSNLDELSTVHGVGKTFLAKYGPTVLVLIRDNQ
jgi:DNA topoisomerase III